MWRLGARRWLSREPQKDWDASDRSWLPYADPCQGVESWNPQLAEFVGQIVRCKPGSEPRHRSRQWAEQPEVELGVVGAPRPEDLRAISVAS